MGIDAHSPATLPATTLVDPWRDFRSMTAARIALGRCGSSLPTREVLDFGLAHARARDAVTQSVDVDALRHSLEAVAPTIPLQTRVSNRDEYLRRPDLGRQLSEASRTTLEEIRSDGPFDLSVIVSDGLSAQAMQHLPAVLTDLYSALSSSGWTLTPILIVPFARVAVQDEIGFRLRTPLTLIVLGERPGLGSPDSLGAYFVHTPEPGKSDADRNCVSNIRPDGLTPAAAAATLIHLLTIARDRKLSGVALKDERVLPDSTRFQSLR